MGYLVGGVLGGRAFLRIIALLRLFLGLGVGGFHALRSDSRLVDSLDGAFDRIPCLNLCHREPPFRRYAVSSGVWRSNQSTFFATTTSLPFWAEYSQVDRVMSLSPYSAVTPVS